MCKPRAFNLPALLEHATPRRAGAGGLAFLLYRGAQLSCQRVVVGSTASLSAGVAYHNPWAGATDAV